MSGFAICLTALALAQGDPAPAAAEKAAEKEPTPVESRTVAPAEAPAPTAMPAPAPAAATNPSSTSSRSPELVPAAAPGKPAPPRAEPPPPALPGPAPSPRADPPAAEPERPRGPAEREQVVLAARAFLDALAAGDADALARGSAERFSFDGDAQSGRDAVRRTWREIVAGRPGPAPRVNGVDVLPAADALARFGKPPARVAALARPGVWVAVGDVGGRAVVLFVAREGGRLAVLGIHD